MTNPAPLDENHPALWVSIETLRRIELDSPNHIKIRKAVHELYQSVAARIDDNVPWSAQNRPITTGLAVLGQSHYGKSYGISSAVRDLPTLVAGCGMVIPPNALSFSTPPYSTYRAIIHRMLVASGYRLKKVLPPDEGTERLDSRLGAAQFTIMAWDGFEWATDMHGRAQAIAADDLKSAWNLVMSIMDHAASPCPVVISGHYDVAVSMNGVGEKRQALRNRMEVVKLDPLSQGAKSAALALSVVNDYCEELGVLNGLSENFSLGNRLVHASNFAFGVVTKLARVAVARAAFEAKGPLTHEHFAAAYAAKMGCEKEANPFEIDRWQDVDPTLMLAKYAAERRDLPEANPATSKRKALR